MMALYADATVAVDEAIDAFHAEELGSLASPGTWLDGEERLAVAEAARAARVAAGQQQRVDTAIDPHAVLPDASQALVERIAAVPRELGPQDFTEAHAAGIDDVEYVETVSLVSRIVNLDVFARGIGVAPRPLGQPRDGQPECLRPAAAADEGAWVHSVPAGAPGRTDALAAYAGDAPQPFIYRALSLVPAEARRCIEGGNVQYLPIANFMDFTYSHQPGLTRAQVEVVAARISALNDCFY